MFVRAFALLLCLAACGSCSMPSHEQQAAANEIHLQQEGISALSSREAAPELEGTTDLQGQPVDLASLLAQHQRGLVLYFFPSLDGPLSRRNLLEWQRRSVKLGELGVGVYGVVPASAPQVSANAQLAALTLPLLCDPQGDTSRAWGCLGPEGSLPQRTTVAVGQEGSIALFYRGVAPEQTLNEALGLNGK